MWRNSTAANPIGEWCLQAPFDITTPSMNQQPSDERRRHVRCVLSTEFRGAKLLPSGVTDASSEIFQGVVQNFSENGLSLLVNRKFNQFDVIRGQVILPGTATGVPSLLQVCWVQRATKKFQFHVGLRFLV